ncbi:MAG: CotH kinase family protein, partial [Bacteroidota bacterium]|nr:CotH kinase family protein [Bacteroidota bacterium]
KVYCKTFFVNYNSVNNNFPFVSIVTDSLNLFDNDSGIFIPGKYYDETGWDSWWPAGNYSLKGNEWERAVHFDFFTGNKELQIATNAGIRMHGCGSLTFPQKSFKLYFRNEYGMKEIDFPIFKDIETTVFKRLIFRNSGNDFLETHFRDALLQFLLKDIDIEIQGFQPCQVFINGEYWGIYNIRERQDKYYFENRFDIPEDSLILLGICGSEIVGSNLAYSELVDFIIENDVDTDESFRYFDSVIDLRNFYDYNIAEIYYANYDWPCNNNKFWKTTNANSKWRWLIYDLDLSFGYRKDSKYSYPSLQHATAEGVYSWPNCDCSTFLLRNLLKNETIKNKFVERFAYHLNNTFETQKVLQAIAQFRELYKPVISEHISRWSYPSEYYIWENNINTLCTFAEKRPCEMKQQIIEFFNLDTFAFQCNYPDLSKLYQHEIKLFPNPSSGIITLFFDRHRQVECQIEVYDIWGQKVFSDNAILIGHEIQLDFSRLINGMYFLRANISDEQLHGKFLISK